MKRPNFARIAQLSNTAAIVDAVESQQARRAGSEREYVAPQGRFEEAIAEIWMRLLRVERVGRADDFFQLGGHSLLATQMISRMWESFAAQVPLVEIFRHTTLETFAAAVEKAVSGNDTAALAPLMRGVTPAKLPLSYGQQRFWFLDQLEPGSLFYNVASKWRLHGALNTAALEAAVSEVVARHEVLRTTYAVEGGHPVQVIAPVQPVALPAIDLRDVPDREERARALIGEETAKPFDLERGPMFRPMLLKLADDDHVLVLSTHHIATDGWSFGVLRQDIYALYEAFAAGRPSPLTPLPLQYADYALWQRTHLEGAALDRQVAYWKEQLRDAPPSIELPTDRPRPALQTYRGANAVAVLPHELVQALTALSQQQGATLFMTLLAAFYVLMARYSGQEDIVVGSAIAGRTHSDTERLIGLFLNTLALRADVNGDATFTDLLRRVRETTVNAYAHQDVPFERLVEELNPVRDSSRSPLYQVMLVLQNVPPAAGGMAGLQVGAFGATQETSQMDLLLTLVDQPEGLTATLTYNTDLFDASTVERMLAHYRRLLEGVAEDASVRVAALPLVGPDELQQLVAFNATEQSFSDGCLHQLVAAQVKRTPDATAVRFENKQLSYRELDGRANQLAHYLVAHGVRPGALVGVCAERSLEMVIALVGVQKAGAAYVPIDPEYPLARLESVIEDAAPPVLLTQEHLLPILPATLPPVLCLDRDWKSIAEFFATAPDVSVTGKDLAYAIYTSGSTGKPKGVPNVHEGIVNRLCWMQHQYGLTPADRVLQKTPYSFDVSVWEFFWPLMQGACIVMARPQGHKDPDYLVSTIRAEKITTMHFVPSMLRAFLESPGVEACSSLKRVMCSGEALTGDVVERFFERLPSVELHNLYGPTEAAVDVTYFQCKPDLQLANVPIGRPVWNTQVHILSPSGQLQPIGVPGELNIAGVQLARGYLNRPELTAERFVQNPFSTEEGARMYRTGDLCRWLADGNIEYYGRLDHQVKIRGFRIELGEIEATLRQHPDVSDCVVIAREDNPGDKRLVAYLISRSGSDIEPAELRTTLKKTLPDYMVPSAFITLECMPLTSSGKLDRKTLPAPESYAASEGEGRPPRAGAETMIAEIWKSILRVSTVHAEDDFFRLGGHSLLATQMVSRVREAAGVKLPLVEIFRHSTLESFAKVVEAAGGEEKAASIRVARPERLPLSYAQQRLWFLDRLERGSAFYNIALTWRLEGALNVAALETALNDVIARHEVLRTTYAMAGEDAVQVIAPALHVELPVVDLSTDSEAERESRARVLVGEEVQRPFDLERGPVFRVKLFRLSDEEHVLVFTAHHIAFDGWSNTVLLGDLTRFYRKALGVDTALMEPLPIQYADYAVWQREHLRGEALDAQLEYWKQHLKGAPPSIELPTDRPRPAFQTYRGASRSVMLPKTLVESLKTLGQREGATLYMVLLASFYVLLSRCSGQDDIVVGSAIAGRTRTETEKLIGLFVNALALRIQTNADASFADLLRRVRETTVNAYAHQDVPFERLVEELNPVRDSSRSPLYQVMLVLQNTPVQKAEMPGLRISGYGSPVETSQLDLLLDVQEQPEGLKARLTYNTDLFNATTIERLLMHFGVLLQSVVAPGALDKRVVELELLGPERERVLVEWNRTDVDFGAFAPPYAAFLARAEREPLAVALESDGVAWSNRELATYAMQLAQRVTAEGLKPGQLVGVCVPRSPEMLAAVLAVMMAGGAYVPLDPRHPRERLQMVLDDAGAALVLTKGELELETSAKVLDVSAVAPGDASWQPVAIDAESLAYVIYTSGSTGRPKGVAIEHGALMNLLRSMQREPGLTADDVLVAVTTLSFDIAGLELLLPLLTGARLVIATDDEVIDGNLLRSLLQRTHATVLQATPSTWRMLIDAGWTHETPLKALCGGEALPRELADKLLDRAAEVWNVYGPTETTIWSSATRVTRGTGTLRIGPPIANTQFYVLDKWRQPVPIGVAGELYIGGDGLARGYWNRPELTAEKFVANPFGPGRIYAAGDVARWHDDGTIELLGRADFQVKIRGFRIELGEIEAALRRESRVSDCVVIAREDEPGDPRLVAYVVAAQPIDASELRALLKETLPEYMIPAAFVMLDGLPQTPNGKVDRKALPAPASYDRPAGGGTLRTPMEEMVAAIFSDVLKLEVLGGSDNFFELGGHSLSAMQVMARVQRALGIDVPLRVLFESPTVAALAAKIESLRGGTVVAAPPIVAVPRDRPLALSFAQQRLWFLAQMDPDNPLYNVPLAMRLKGALDVCALQQAMDAVVARHEVLRTRYAVENDEPVQVIDAPRPLDLPVIDLSAMAEAEREAEVARILAREVARPFYLATDWMLRPLLVRMDAETHVLLINTHHIATDGWSNAVLLRDLAAFYAEALGVKPAELPDLAIQYADYAVWQRNWLQGEVLEEQLAFWKKTLEGAPPLLQLPADRPRPELQTHSGGVHRFEVPSELIESLRALGRGEGATPFMLMLAAFQVLMYYYVKQPDIVLGTDLANRTTVQTEDLVGFFVNLMVVRTDLSGDISFRELIGRVRHRTLDSYAHQDVPFDKLVEELQPERSRSHTPLVQVLFVQQNTPRSELAMPGLELSGVSLALPSKFDIAVFVRESERGLAGVWQYNADLFNAATIERMAALYPVILKTITAEPETKLKAMLEMLAEWELQHNTAVLEESRAASRQKLKSVRRAVVTS